MLCDTWFSSDLPQSIHSLVEAQGSEDPQVPIHPDAQAAIEKITGVTMSHSMNDIQLQRAARVLFSVALSAANCASRLMLDLLQSAHHRIRFVLG